MNNWFEPISSTSVRGEDQFDGLGRPLAERLDRATFENFISRDQAPAINRQPGCRRERSQSICPIQWFYCS